MKIICNIFIMSILFHSIINCNAQDQKHIEKEIIEQLAIYQKAVNKNNFKLFKSILSNEFHLPNESSWGSFFTAFAIISLNDTSHSDIISLKDFQFTYIDTSNQVKVKFNKNYSTGLIKPAEVIFIKEQDVWKLYEFSKGFFQGTFDEPFTLTFSTDADVDNVFDYTDKMKILNLKEYQYVVKNGYKVYYDKKLINYAEMSLNMLVQIDSIIKNRFGILNVTPQHVALTTFKGSLMILGGESVFTINDLSSKNKTSQKIIIEELITVISHEIAEEALVENYGMPTFENRWYRDGMAEYVAHTITKHFSAEIFKKEFVDVRYEEYKIYKGKGNLLDWRGNGAIENEVGTLVGDKYIYAWTDGQYGRALQFFIDLVNDYEDDIIIEFHKQLQGKKNLSAQNVLSVMSKITGEDMTERISKY